MNLPEHPAPAIPLYVLRVTRLSSSPSPPFSTLPVQQPIAWTYSLHPLVLDGTAVEVGSVALMPSSFSTTSNVQYLLLSQLYVDNGDGCACAVSSCAILRLFLTGRCSPVFSMPAMHNASQGEPATVANHWQMPAETPGVYVSNASAYPSYYTHTGWGIHEMIRPDVLRSTIDRLVVDGAENVRTSRAANDPTTLIQ